LRVQGLNLTRDAAVPVDHGAKNIKDQDLDAVGYKRRGVHDAILSREGVGAVTHKADKGRDCF
jgi:hypothetical protein